MLHFMVIPGLMIPGHVIHCPVIPGTMIPFPAPARSNRANTFPAFQLFWLKIFY